MTDPQVLGDAPQAPALGSELLHGRPALLDGRDTRGSLGCGCRYTRGGRCRLVYVGYVCHVGRLGGFVRQVAPALGLAAPMLGAGDRVQVGERDAPAMPAGALCQVAPRPDGFRHRELRPLVAGLLGRDLDEYSAGAMTYDLRHLRLHGLLERQPHSFRYRLTPDGLHLAFGLSRIVLRLLQPGWAALLAPSSAPPAPLREALLRLDAALADLQQAA